MPEALNADPENTRLPIKLDSTSIAPELRQKHDYAEMTPQLRAKIFGLNAWSGGAHA